MKSTKLPDMSILLIAFLMLIAGCGGGTDNNTKAVVSDQISGVDYEAIHKKAMEFVPKIGKSGGEMIISSISAPKTFNPITSGESSTS